MRGEGSINSAGGTEGVGSERSVGAVVFNQAIKHFLDILSWARVALTMTCMIKLRHQQPSLWHRGLAEDIEGLWEPWMRLVDKLLEDEELLDTVYEAQGERHAQSRAESLKTMVDRVGQVVKQTRILIFAGDTKSPGKIVSVFEPHTEIIRKGKASKPNEFGKLVKIQEAENQIVTHFEVYAERPADSTL